MKNLTPRVQQVLVLARKTAEETNYSEVRIEHLFLGILNLGQGVAVNVLLGFGIDLKILRDALIARIPQEVPKTTGRNSYTEEAKAVFRSALEESQTMNQNWVGTEHVLLGILLQGQSIAAALLNEFGVSLERAREQVLKFYPCPLGDLS